ncbi:serine/threonine-protein kinase [Streptomyces sp. NPDC047928]|uniref:serine/threonine-protein kinase n=1 Tax=unclassified Streptomyces TaxID=2593676 RepID=UPI00371B4F25
MSMSEAGRPLVDGRFELISRLGSGGMGTVWRARDIALDREVALKEVRPPDPAAEEATPGLTAQLRERAVREARALARLSNPHVVTIHHIVEPADGSHPWIVMELVEGCSVYDRLARGPMPVPEVIRLGLQVLSALRAAHSAGIQHRDVKPANVLLRPDGSAVLTDFGIAVLREATSRLTSTGDLIGSPEFIAPERVRGEEGNPASDLWSLGMLLYVAAEGHHPLRRATSLATVVAVLDDPIPAPVRSGALAPVLTRLLVRDPALRPDGAALERLLSDAAAPGSLPAADGAGPDTAPAPAAAAGPAPAPVADHDPRRAHGPRPVHAPYGTHPAYGPPAHAAWTPSAGTPSAGTVPAAVGNGVFGPPSPPGRRPRRRAVTIALAVAATVAAGVVGGVGILNRLSDERSADGAKDARPSATATGTPAPSGGATPAADDGSTGAGADTGTAAPRGTLLTTANVRAVIGAFREASGNSQVKGVTIYEEYAMAEIPTKPGAKTYDRYEYRNGVARRAGPGGTIDPGDADEQPFDATTMAWDGLPALMKRGERELKVERPNMRYLILDRWTFNSDRPTLRFYLSNEYHAGGYIAADSSGEVVATYPAS